MKYNIQNADSKTIDGEYISYINTRAEKGLFEVSEDSVNAVRDSHTVQHIMDVADRFHENNLEYVFVIGIGGSSLGSKAVVNAYIGVSGVTLKTKILWFESVSPRDIAEIKSIVNYTKDKTSIAVLVISKSGGTTETLANASAILTICEEKWCDFGDRVVAITNEDSNLHRWADEYGAETIFIRKIIGGRFSLFTAVTLLPLALLDLSIKDFISGGIDAVEKNSKDSFCVKSSEVFFGAYNNNQKIIDTFVFGSELEDIGKWYRQLIGESLGKERDIDNKIVNTGILPTVSVGSNDLHSVGQLYLGGPKDKITLFLSAKYASDAVIPRHSILKKTDFISGKTTNEINNAILNGTLSAYTEHNLPFISVELEQNILHELGFLMQSLLVQTMILGHMMRVNAFNQPNVESYKIVTKKILER